MTSPLRRCLHLVPLLFAVLLGGLLWAGPAGADPPSQIDG